jgi:hypothetical protein
MRSLLFTLTFYWHFPTTQFVPYSINFVLRGFTECAAFEGLIPALDEGLLYLDLTAATIVTQGVEELHVLVRWTQEIL